MKQATTRSTSTAAKSTATSANDQRFRDARALESVHNHQEERRSNGLYIRVGYPLQVVVMRDDCGVDLRSKWEQLNWRSYEVIAEGARRIAAPMMGLSLSQVALSKSLLVSGNTVTPRFSLEVPKEFEARLTDLALRAAIDDYLSGIKGQDVSRSNRTELAEAQNGLNDSEPRHVTAKEHVPCGVISQPAEQLAGVVQEVRARIGGTTLPFPCVVESPAWDSSLQLCGKLAPKPKLERREPDVVTLDCLVDGFIKSQRIVHLLLAANGGRRDVVFDETIWLRQIIEYAALPGQWFQAEVEEVQEGTKTTRTLLNLSKVADASP